MTTVHQDAAEQAAFDFATDPEGAAALRDFRDGLSAGRWSAAYVDAIGQDPRIDPHRWPLPQVFAFMRVHSMLMDGDGPAVADLAKALAETTANLDTYIERRAHEIAAPRIAAVEKQARERIADLEQKAADDRQRAGDLVAELRRHVDAQVRRAERAEKKLTEETTG